MIPNNVMSLLKTFIGNNIPQINTPDEMAQYLLNTGKVNQAQVNQVRQMWENPQIRQMINNKYK